MKKLLLVLFVLSFSLAKADENFKKWEVKFNYTSFEETSVDEEIPYISLYFREEDKYTLIYNREQVYRDDEKFRNGEYLELYKGNFYYILGQTDFMNLNLGVEYYYKVYTFGIKLNDYDTQDVIFYKFQADHYFKNSSIGSLRATVVSAEDISIDYMGKIVYKIWSYSHYFDFEDLNKGIVEVKLNKKDSIYDINAGYGYDFHNSRTGIILGFGVKF